MIKCGLEGTGVDLTVGPDDDVKHSSGRECNNPSSVGGASLVTSLVIYSAKVARASLALIEKYIQKVVSESNHTTHNPYNCNCLRLIKRKEKLTLTWP
ncbi:unnamed protein product [Prunus armeniaca]